MSNEFQKDMAGLYGLYKLRQGVDEQKRANESAERDRRVSGERDREHARQQKEFAKEHNRLKEQELQQQAHFHHLEMEQQERNADEVKTALAEIAIRMSLSPDELKKRPPAGARTYRAPPHRRRNTIERRT
jgi:membrane protein involved in colicin uptake